MTKLEFIRRAVSMNTEHIKALAEQQSVLMQTLSEFESGATQKCGWQGLTDEEVHHLQGDMTCGVTFRDVRLVEAKLKEKNG